LSPSECYITCNKDEEASGGLEKENITKLSYLTYCMAKYLKAALPTINHDVFDVTTWNCVGLTLRKIFHVHTHDLNMMD
jgi:hypothetical protein